MAAHSSILAWRIPWREEAGGLQSMGSQRVGHDQRLRSTRVGSRELAGITTTCVDTTPVNLCFVFPQLSFPPAVYVYSLY